MNPRNDERSSITLRRATPADLPALTQIHLAAVEASQHSSLFEIERRWGALACTWTAGQARQRPFQFEAWVAEIDGRVAGFSGWLCPAGSPIGEIKGNYVFPELWGRGISTRLVGEVLRELRALGPQILKVRTEESALAARHVYEKVGFELLVLAPHYARRLTAEDARDAPRSTGKDVILRPATAGDLPAVASLARPQAERWESCEPILLEKRHGPIGGVSWRERYAPPADVSSLLVAEKGGSVAGWLAFRPGGQDRNARFAGMAVEPDADEGAVGRALVEEMVRRAAVGGAEIITTEILETDRPAIAALETAGFERVGAITIYTRET